MNRLLFTHKKQCPFSSSCLLPLKSLSCLGSRPFSIFWNTKKFVLPFPPLLLKLVPNFQGLRHKKLCPNILYFSCFFSRFFPCLSCLPPAFSPDFLRHFSHALSYPNTWFIGIFQAFNQTFD